MAVIRTTSSQVPITEKLVDSSGSLSSSWEKFFRWIYDVILPLGSEKYFPLKNNVANQSIDELQFDSTKINLIFIDYIAQRISTAAGGTELIEAGTLRVVYKPKANTWSVAKINDGPDNAGVTFSMSAQGTVLVSTSNMTGTFGATSVSKLTYRARTISAKINKPFLGWI